MADSGTPVDAELFTYIAEHTQGDDAFLVEMKAAAEEAGIPSISIGPAQASFLQVLLKSVGAREVVEVGALAGYSAHVMARALPAGGRVRTIEFDADRASFIRSWTARSDSAGKIEVFHGAGVDVLPGFEDASADAIFIDADKANYPHYLHEGLRIVRPGGLLLVDNAFAFGRLLDESDQTESVAAIRAFNEAMAASNLHGVIVPMGDGMWVAVRP